MQKLKNNKNDQKFKNNLGIIYNCIHQRIYDKSGFSREMDKKSFFWMLGLLYKVPKNLKWIVLKEMEGMNMIKNMGSRKNNYIEIFPPKINILEIKYNNLRVK